jgi:hypothetical protein
MSRSDRLSRWFPLILALAAAAYRLFLTTRYYGWEESDYGNLAMARGVLDSGFLEYDMRHLPLYYFVSAVVLVFVGNTIVATHLVSTVSGVAAVVLGYLIARRAFDEGTARITGLLLCFQPEYALYASSSLRDPLFAALGLLGCYLLLRGRARGAAVATGFSFLTRFDTLGTNMPALLLHLLRRPPRVFSVRHPAWTAVGVFVCFVGAWSVYCGQVHGTYIFFGQTVQMNVDTGGARELVGPTEFIRHGLEIDAGLFLQTMPSHLGPLCWGAALLGMWVHRHDLLARSARGTVFTYLVLNTLFWLAVGFVAQHEPNHNLYWIWMYSLISYWCMFAAAGLRWMVAMLNSYLSMPAAATAALMAIGIGGPFYRQTRAQLEQSAQLYRPQLELAEWVEANVPPQAALIFDNIPACYVNRRPHEWRFISWYDVPVPQGDEEAMATYLQKEQIKYVLWFKEDWTQAPAIAPYLSEVRPHVLGPETLVPLYHEEQYGFIFYKVVSSAGAAP